MKTRRWWNRQIDVFWACLLVVVMHLALRALLAKHDVVSSVFAAGSHLPIWMLPCAALFAISRLLSLLVVPGLLVWRAIVWIGAPKKGPCLSATTAGLAATVHVLLATVCLAGAAADSEPIGRTQARLLKVRDALRPLCKPMDKPGPMDWLAAHDESGQSLRHYLLSEPVTVRGDRTVIYVQPIGRFSKKQQAIVDQTAAFLGEFYSCPVVTRKTLSASIIPAKGRRNHPVFGQEQFLTTYILDSVLRPRLPKNAVAYLAFMSSDLWPGEGWNYVFGQASLRDRVGVWSLRRFGDPEKSNAAETLCLRRTFKLAAHEVGHMFSMFHCTAYQCGMCGSNHLAEADKRPLHFCAECMPKVCWATRTDPLVRAKALDEFLRGAGLQAEAEFYSKTVETLLAK